MSIDTSAESSFMTWKYEGAKTKKGQPIEKPVPDNQIRNVDIRNKENTTVVVTQTRAQEVRAAMNLANNDRLKEFRRFRGFLPLNEVSTGVNVVVLTARANRKAAVHA